MFESTGSTKRRCVLLCMVLLASVPAAPLATLACPFCSAVTNTLSEDITAVDAAVIARLVRKSPAEGGDARPSSAGRPSINSPLATFAIDQVLKGKALVRASNHLTTPFFGDAQPGDLFLVMGSDPKQLTWTPPLPLNQRQREYLQQLVTLPKEGPHRLAFFQQYLRDPDKLLAQDAYDEFARAPYDMVKQLKEKMDHDRLVQWVQDPEIPGSERGLYLTMLGICGNRDDLPMLEQRLRSTDPQHKMGLNALIACYLTLRGPDGMELVEDLFLRQREGNFSDNYADVYAAIMALRFHGSQVDVIPRTRVLTAFALLLDNPIMADLVIADLARWEDWSHLKRLVKLFKEADSASSFLRVPIVRYVRACPLPAAKEALEEFRRLDPRAVERATVFYSGTSSSEAPAKISPKSPKQ